MTAMFDSTERCALIANFGGIGNGFMVLPILGALERAMPQLSYFHIENPVFHEPSFLREAHVTRLSGEVPSIWRRFNLADQEDILRFIDDRRIDLIINLRNEDQSKDVDWRLFREKHSDRLEYWELFDAIDPNRNRHITKEMVRLFAAHASPLVGYDQHYLRSRYKRSSKGGCPTIGFAPSSKNAIKSWAVENWIELGQFILTETHAFLDIIAGPGGFEQKRAGMIINALQTTSKSRLTLRQDLTLDELAIHLGGLTLLVANDSAPVHLATAIDIACIGLYFATDATVWGGCCERFSSVQSKYFYDCPQRKPLQGNCLLYDSVCPAPCQEEITVQKVIKELRSHLF